MFGVAAQSGGLRYRAAAQSGGLRYGRRCNPADYGTGGGAIRRITVRAAAQSGGLRYGEQKESIFSPEALVETTVAFGSVAESMFSFAEETHCNLIIIDREHKSVKIGRIDIY